MKHRSMKATAIVIFAILMFAQIPAFGQDLVESNSVAKEQTWDSLLIIKGGARALEGVWTVQMTIRNCATGAPLVTFAKMNTFMQGGTASEFSVGSAPLPRGPAHGIWRYDGEHNYSYALQFFRFNVDGTYSSLTKARWQAEMDESGGGYSATAAIEVFNPAGVLIATACATETAVRFE